MKGTLERTVVMRMMGVVAILLAVAALLVSVTKAESHRHGEPGCARCSLDHEPVGTSELSFESALGSDLELAMTGNEYETNRDADNLGREITIKPGHEAVLKHAASDLADVVRERDKLTEEAPSYVSPTESPVSGNYLGDSHGRESRSGRFTGAPV